MDCLFCKIVSGEIPSYKVYEDGSVFAFLDIHPRAPGHTVVVPKGHYPTLLELPGGEDASFWSAVKKIAGKAKEALGADGLTIGVNHGSVSGQTVPHLHAHIMPRFEGDGGGSMHSVVNNPPQASLEEMVEKLKLM